MTRPESILRDSTRVAPSIASVVSSMLDDPRHAYRESAEAAVAALHQGSLIGIQTSSSRFLIVLHCWRARPVAAPSGALVQVMEAKSPPLSDRDLIGWIVWHDDLHGGSIVLVHELGHFLNRFVVWTRSQEPAPVVRPDLAQEGNVQNVRAQWLNEVAARHLAYLAEQGVDPISGPMPQPGAFFGCAVKIGSYPHVYNDTGYMTKLVGCNDPDLLFDQLGIWMEGLRDFRFFVPGSPRAHAHAAWLEREIQLAKRGHRAPRVALEGTL